MKSLKTTLFLVFLLAGNLVLSAAIPAAERQALIDLYNSTNGDAWTNKTSWKTAPLRTDGFAMPGTENTWYGVITDAVNTTVQQLYLTNNNLIGTLPSSLGNLSNVDEAFSLVTANNLIQIMNGYRLNGTSDKYDISSVDLIYDQDIPLCYVYHLVPYGHLVLSAHYEQNPIKSISRFSDFFANSSRYERTVIDSIRKELNALANSLSKDDSLTGNLCNNKLCWQFWESYYPPLRQNLMQHKAVPVFVSTSNQAKNLSKVNLENGKLFNSDSSNLLIPDEPRPKNIQTQIGAYLFHICRKCEKQIKENSQALFKVKTSSLSASIALIVNSTYAQADYFEDFVLTGAVHNDGGTASVFTKISIVLFDKNNINIGTGWTYIYGGTNVNLGYGIYTNALRSGEKGFFKVWTSCKFSQVDNYTYTIEWSEYSYSLCYTQLSFNGIPITSSSLGNLQIVGEIKNSSNNYVSYFTQADFAIYDSNSKVIDTDFTYVDGDPYKIGSITTNTAIYPGQSKPFTEYTLALYSKYLTYEYSYEWDEANTSAVGVPTIGLSKTSFNFGSERNGTPTHAGTSVITNTGTGTLNWTATPSANWISVSPVSGTGSGVLTIGIARTDMSPGSYAGTITITAPNATNSPQTINVGLNIAPVGTSSVPFGSFDTPKNGTTVSSSIAVTGWTLDDVETTVVKISRDSVGAEPPGSRIYIGDAVFVEGSRSDVEIAYPTYPLKSRSGWGYMLLTNFLPNGGNGTFTLYATATDREGHSVVLDSKTITCDNLHAVKPFGAIDTPGQGEEISGSLYYNFGWALTPLPNSIPTDGSTIWVWVDGVPLGHPSYNHYRDDIATLFPGYANSNAAVGVYDLNTTAFTNGVHTIAWSVVDNAGNEDGIGSRYFSILNAGTPTLQGEQATAANHAVASGAAVSSFTKVRELAEFRAVSMNPIHARRGFNRSLPPESVIPRPGEGTLFATLELERLEILLDDHALEVDANRRTAERAGLTSVLPIGHRYEGYLIVGDELRPLPIGSTLDANTGIFSWLPGPGFLGNYRLAFVDRESRSRLFVTIKIGS
ncbi:MAG: BACON domain-containing protein [Candidatus Aminicenantes bacterium]|nr:BACON domain-containing protein [Candidatus Aminicenantes bacterium]